MPNTMLILRTLTSPYGDQTKGSVLAHEDVDNNFIFLKGGLIQTATTANGNLILTKNDGSMLSVSIASFTGGTLSGDVFTTASTYNASTGTLTNRRNDGINYSTSGWNYVSAATLVSNVLSITSNGGSATNTTINAATGGTYANGTITLSGTGVLSNITGLTFSSGTDIFTTASTYNPSTGVITFTKNNATTYSATGWNYISAATLVNNILNITSNGGSVVNTTINAATGGTYANGTITLSGTGTLGSITGITVTGGGGTTLTSGNAITVSGGAINLGGNLSADTIIKGSGIEKLAINGLGYLQLNPSPNNVTNTGDLLQIYNGPVNHVITGSGDGWFAKFQPSNYGTTYTAGSPSLQVADRFYQGYGRFDGVNSDGRPNIVGIPWAYNATVGGGRAESNDAGFQFRTETHYILGEAMFEFHLPEITANNNSAYRLLSFYANKNSGTTFVNTTTDSWAWEIRDSIGPRFWATMAFNKAVAGVGGCSFNLDSDATASTSTMAFRLGGQNLTDNGLAGAVLSLVSNFADNYSVLQYGIPTGKSFFIEAETITFNDTISTGKSNFYGRTALPSDGSNAGLSIGAGVSAAFPVGAKIHIYGDGTTTATKAFVIDQGNPFSNSVIIYDDGTAMFNKSGGQFAMGYLGLGNIEATAKLAVSSTTQGFLPPRGTTTQRLAISVGAADEGLEFYDTTLHKKFVYDGTVWQACW